MKIGFSNPEYEKKINEDFDFYIQMIKESNPGTKDFNFASDMLRHYIDFMRYNSEAMECRRIPTQQISVEAQNICENIPCEV
jgi:hypothetical protein